MALLRETIGAMKTRLNVTNDTPGITIPPKFEQLGSRYFFIEHKIQKNWLSAASTCRQMGGHLAAFHNIRDYLSLREKLNPDTQYWMGISRLPNPTIAVSLASGNLIRDVVLESNRRETQGKFCATLSRPGLFFNNCDDSFNFICQADDL
ncbi:hypothetical protein M5D96_013738 [Drosophila gunungcola]|uniref:C-type lectin domain-containing protein n=1 Tax=Drosophila gunungcola TaxID=103775 RepID=A0A9P9YAT1_9MUSC|nr:hypothetical protein M5D96_013738 [Drosophila gunungcola]